MAVATRSGLLGPAWRGLAMAGAAAALAAAPMLSPNFDGALIARQPWVIQLHLAAAVGALILGAGLMAGVRGRTAHRIGGWAWVALIVVTAGSSLFIRHINPGGFSFIHALSAWTLLIVPVAVLAARRHKVVSHRRIMMGVFFGGVLIAGAFAFMPGRLLWSAVVG